MGNTDQDRAHIARLETQVAEGKRLAQALQTELSGLSQKNERLAAENERLQRSEKELERFRTELVNIKLQLREELREAEAHAVAARNQFGVIAGISHEVRTRLNSLLILSKQLDAHEAGSKYARGIAEAAVELEELMADFFALVNTDSAEAGNASITLGAIEDDRDVIEKGDRVLLIVTGDERLAQNLLDEGHERGFESVVTGRRDAVLPLARRFSPDAVVMEYRLSEAGDESILDTLRHDQETRHIPVYMYAGRDAALDSLQRGAKGILWKPGDNEAISATFDAIQEFTDRPLRRVLVACEDSTARNTIIDAIDDDDVEITVASTGEQALELLGESCFDCAVLGLGLSDMSGLGFVLRAGAAKVGRLPLVFHTGKNPSPTQETKLEELSRKRIVRRCESLLSLVDETSFFLHRTESRSHRLRTKIIESAHGELTGARVLMVDDNLRNLFAMTALLEDEGVQIRQAQSGPLALDLLQKEPRPDLVLMDIMMPEMDGFETIRRIRNEAGLRALPIIALTAKAMKGDREACIAAGASDYMSKPIDTDKLLALVRAWLQS